MNWINNFIRPKLQRMFNWRETPDNLWHKCPSCGNMIFHRELKANLYVCSGCNLHMKMPASERFSMLFDGGAYDSIDTPDIPVDPLEFRDKQRYTKRLEDARRKTGAKDSVELAHGKIRGVETVVAVQDFAFMGGSLGTAAGEAIIRGAQAALEHRCAYIIITSSGGARMQEGILSLMQLPRTTIAIQALQDARLPYLCVLADPTTGGVTASYAMLGDVQIAETGALIGFAGPRVIEQVIRETLPEGFQRAEYLLEHGMLDIVVQRKELRSTLGRLLQLMTESLRRRNGGIARIESTEESSSTSGEETSPA
ncbi:MAG: acetyl-CoA carboxylase, carboxyltransferase subunit beta [Hyphomicrobiales bacterium]|nr:acetyl-CoA carboxylase, carboxyltransferase subunit beta [Hyphomicrobiales bacterium]